MQERPRSQSDVDAPPLADPAGGAAADVYRFSGFVLDAAKRTLRRDSDDGAPIHLAHKPFSVLLTLLENRHRVVPRQELLERWWNGQDVYDDALRKAVGAIRAALDDPSERSRIIQTNRRSGYRFIAGLQYAGPVLPQRQAPAGAMAAPPSTASPAPAKPRLYWLLLAAAAGFCTVVVAGNILRRVSVPAPLAGLHAATPAAAADEALQQTLERARHFRDQRAARGMGPCVDTYRQVLKTDPDNAEALQGVADCLQMALWIVKETPELREEAKQAALEAVAHHPLSGGARVYLAGTYQREYDDRAAEQQFEQALSLDPDNAEAHHRYSLFLSTIGASDAAIAQARRAVELAPQSLPYMTDVGLAYQIARRYDDALGALMQVLELSPGFAHARGYYADNLFLKGDCERGQHEAIIGASIEPTVMGDSPGSNLSRANYALCRGDRAQAQRFRDALAAEPQREGSIPHRLWWLAVMDAQLGNREQAIAELLQLDREHSLSTLSVPVDPRLDSLRDDPRFQALQDRVLGNDSGRSARNGQALRPGENAIAHYRTYTPWLASADFGVLSTASFAQPGNHRLP